MAYGRYSRSRRAPARAAGRRSYSSRRRPARRPARRAGGRSRSGGQTIRIVMQTAPAPVAAPEGQVPARTFRAKF